ncbi:hypothetical protein [Streptomyces sp. NPDC018000]|uniref:hypothetical protein n=1 Tax=Streptomyces sp. NPDC018000 TaxID=3365028 RepID=UPI0037A688A7
MRRTNAKARFAAALGPKSGVPPVVGVIEVHSHKFLPVFIGVERARRLRAHMTRSAGTDRLESSAARVEHPDAQKCVLHVFACGVAVFHLVQPHEPASLTELAVWRYRSYASDLPWARDKVRDFLGEGTAPEGQHHPRHRPP